MITSIYNIEKSTPTKRRVVMGYWRIKLNSTFYTKLLKKKKKKYRDFLDHYFLIKHFTYLNNIFKSIKVSLIFK